ncbi:Spc98 family-domain-containing protein [Coprinopsis sp. MPI-PUGE-AT-0042]|nr:Spc98 family-domain-containing protein [Coprinopsis sp. MPI-PUGE-AT-0042]
MSIPAGIWDLDPLDIEQLDGLNLGETDAGRLPPIESLFFLPPLENKPQDPILKSLNASHLNRNRTKSGFTTALLEDLAPIRDELELKPPPEFWTNLVKEGRATSNKTISWDKLRDETLPQNQALTAFMSEQDPLVFAAARHCAQPRFNDQNVKTFYVSEEEFRAALKMLVIGTSSTLFIWDSATDRFVQAGLDPGQTGQIAINAMDEVVSGSILKRFLTIGSLLRRLEEFIRTINQSMVKAGPTVHAYAHALSTTLSYLRTMLSDLASSTHRLGTPLTASWMKYAIYEDTLQALSEMYGRTEAAKPDAYPRFDPSPITIVSTIYNHLSSHYERRSPRDIVAIFAYILDATSKEYLYQVGVSVGYGGHPHLQPAKVNPVKPEDYYAGLDEEEQDGQGEEEDIFEALQKVEVEFPGFFPKPLLDMLPAAQKSLILLKRADPEHPLLSSEESAKKRVEWLWTEEDIVDVWNEFETEKAVASSNKVVDAVPASMTMQYPEEFAEFHVYDREPGHFTGCSALQPVDRSTSLLLTFIQNFPEHLPAITPTLPHLTFLVFRKLLDHAATLSSTLLSLFLSSSGNLNFGMHLELLRSYLLVTAPPFKSRLVEALFSDAGEYEVDNTAHSMSLRSIRRRPTRAKKETAQPSSSKPSSSSKQPWAVGISSNLLEREIWPPVSGDLSFFLRTVIVDSLSYGKDWDDEEARRETRHIVHEEAIWRIGFAIRDLPTSSSTGRDKWLNPLYIEALDFLYMDYKPPRPLNILISDDVLHKYQRIFAFILRLLRVESALKSVFRICRDAADPVFQNLPKTRRLFLHFRFIAQSFVAGLSSYVFDTAIAGNFDPFLARVSPPATPRTRATRSASASGRQTPVALEKSTSSTVTNASRSLQQMRSASVSRRPPRRSTSATSRIATITAAATVGSDPATLTTTSGFTDVFELAQAHSSVLDDILSACLLRTGQKGVSELMRHSLEIVLEFCIVVGEVERKRMKEYEAAGVVEDLYTRFRGKMGSLTKVLKGLVDKAPSSSSPWPSDAHGMHSGEQRSVGGTVALYHLLVRLDLGDWWASKGKRK